MQQFLKSHAPWTKSNAKQPQGWKSLKSAVSHDEISLPLNPFRFMK